MRAYARWYGVTDPAEIETWGIVGLLHDFDYEQNPTEDTHLHVGGRILRERGYPEEVVLAICARSVDRAYAFGGAEAVGRPLDEHIGFLIEALKPIADEIGL
jgi:predicted hydrolase (HD superfamily)